MGGFYRLTELGYRLPAGAQILSPEHAGALDAATDLLGDAEARAAAIVAGAEDAYQAKCREGYAAGLAEAGREALNRLLAETAALDAGLRAIEGEVAALVAAAVRKLVSTFDDDERAAAVVRDALKRMRREKRAELRVAPSQLGAFKAAVGGILADFPEMELVDVVEDPALTAPAVVVETRIGRVEADVTAELADLESLLRGAGRPGRDTAP